MASASTQSKDGVGRNGRPVAAHRRKSETRSRVFRELVHIAADQGASIELGVSTADALQECLDRAVALLRFAQQQVDSIERPDTAEVYDGDEPDSLLRGASLANLPVQDDPLYTVIPNPQGPDLIVPHRYLQMEREARMEVEKLAAMMTQLGIAERVVRVREAEAALLVAAVREAAISAGLSNDQVRRLGEELRASVEAGLKQKQPAGQFTKEQREVVEINRELEDAFPGEAVELPPPPGGGDA